MKINIFLRNRRGFTLAEMLVTVAIVSLISTIVVAGYRAGEKKYTLQSAAQQLLADLRRAQNMALAPSIYDSYVPGMGISFNLSTPDKYLFFLDGRGDGGDKIYGINDKIIDFGEISLPARVKIKDIILANLVSDNKLSIFFEPPDPTTYLNGKNDSGVAAIIILELEGENITKSISIRASGLID